MNYRGRASTVLFGSNRRTALLVAVIAVLLGGGTWLGYPILGTSYWLWPVSLVDWAFVFGFILLSAGVASARVGLLASVWVIVPTHVVIGYYVYTSGGGGIVYFGYTGSRTIDIVLISGLFAIPYGLMGYLLGTAIRRRIDRAPLAKGSADQQGY